MTIVAGAPPGARSSEPAALRALLAASRKPERMQLAALGLRERDLALLLAGAAHLACTCPAARARVRCLGLRPNPDGCRAWSELAAALLDAPNYRDNVPLIAA